MIVAVAKDLVLIRGLHSLITSSALGGVDNGALRGNLKEIQDSQFHVQTKIVLCFLFS